VQGVAGFLDDIQPYQSPAPTYAALRRLAGGRCGSGVKVWRSNQRSNQRIRHRLALGDAVVLEAAAAAEEICGQSAE
jgi:hypothetical protein